MNQRPPSPAPSYHTIPPDTHSTLPSDSTIPESAALNRAALETPDAVLSVLNIHNTSKVTNPRSAGSPKVDLNITQRFVSARTEDGKERYHISFPSGQEMKIFKGNSVGGQSLIATTMISAIGVKVVFADGEKVDGRWEEIQEKQRLRLRLRVRGEERAFAWQVVAGEAEEVVEGGRRNTPVMGIESRRKKQQMQRIIGMRLVDEEEGKVWAGYVHGADKEGDVKITGKTGRWGYVEIKCRAVMLDDGVDRAFVTLMALLESYVRLFGRENPGLEKWGVLTGVLFCSVM